MILDLKLTLKNLRYYIKNICYITVAVFTVSQHVIGTQPGARTSDSQGLFAFWFANIKGNTFWGLVPCLEYNCHAVTAMWTVQSTAAMFSSTVVQYYHIEKSVSTLNQDKHTHISTQNSCSNMKYDLFFYLNFSQSEQPKATTLYPAF